MALRHGESFLEKCKKKKKKYPHVKISNFVYSVKFFVTCHKQSHLSGSLKRLNVHFNGCHTSLSKLLQGTYVCLKCSSDTYLKLGVCVLTMIGISLRMQNMVTLTFIDCYSEQRSKSTNLGKFIIVKICFVFV